VGGSTITTEKVYDSLARTEESGEEFGFDDLRDTTGSFASTSQTHLIKEIQNCIVHELKEGGLVSDGVTEAAEYKRVMWKLERAEDHGPDQDFCHNRPYRLVF